MEKPSNSEANSTAKRRALHWLVRPQTADEALERPLPDNLSRILCEVADAGPGNDTYQCLDMPYQRLAHKKTTVVIV